jgi:hypothetical protein
LLCDRSISSFKADNVENECYDSYLDEYINRSPIKFVTRANIKNIIDEQALSQSGLTKEKVAELGKLYSASHILFYKQLGPYGDEEGRPFVTIHYKFKLVNTSTSEIEYSTNVYDYTEDYKNKNRTPVFGVFITPGGAHTFFHTLFINSTVNIEANKGVNPEDIPPWRRR